MDSTPLVSQQSTRRTQVMVGELPSDFLRVSHSTDQQQIAADHQTAAMMQAQGMSVFAPSTSRLSLTITQAKLNKNYGLTKMDPYCRVRVGHSVFETNTAHSGGKNPIWNKVIHAAVPTGVDSFYIEIYDERAFTMDDRVAWAHITIPERVFSGETVDDWYQLSGRLGEEQEGSVNLVLSYTKVQTTQRVVYSSPTMQPMYAPPMQPIMIMPSGAPMPMYYTPYQPAGGVMPGGAVPPHQPPPQQPIQQGPAFTDDDVKMVQDMFPDTDEDVIRSILEVNMGDKDATINNLLAMQS